MKPIKFDLPLNGTRIGTLEQLEENLTPEILEPFRSGKLAKWLRVRSLNEQAEATEALLAADSEDEVQLFKSLCEVFVSEVDEHDAREMIEEYIASIALKNADSEVMGKAHPIELLEGDDEKQYTEPSSHTETIKEAQQSKLLEEGDENQRAELASYPDLSEKLQNKLVQDQSEPVLVALASNPSLLGDVQAKLASTGTPAVREALGANPRLNEKQQNYLATTGSEQVKCRLAGNPLLIVTVQCLLAGDEDSSVRTALAANPSINSDCQTQLMEDQNWSVKCSLARNPALTDDFQQQMAVSEDDGIITSLAKNPSLSDELMAKLAVSDIVEVKESLASNTALPESLQARLIANNHGNVREILAGNPALKVAQQAELTNSACNIGDVHVRLALLDNPSIDESLKKRIIASFDKYDLSSMEIELNYETECADKLFSEVWPASNKAINSMTGLFQSEKRTERLFREVDIINDRLSKMEHKRDVLEKTVRRLKDILRSEPTRDGVNNV